MNALLQHRGGNLMSAGRALRAVTCRESSIAPAEAPPTQSESRR